MTVINEIPYRLSRRLVVEGGMGGWLILVKIEVRSYDLITLYDWPTATVIELSPLFVTVRDIIVLDYRNITYYQQS